VSPENQAAPISEGITVLYSPTTLSYMDVHERATRVELAKRLAALKGLTYADEYDPAACYRGRIYFAPSDTLANLDEANHLGIRTEHDLFGGVVPHPFIATKVITHPLVDPGACAPTGWSHEFPHRVREVVLNGFSAFSGQDAIRAGLRLLEHGPIRIKPVRETGGRGQTVATRPAELEAALKSIASAELAGSGVVIEENLRQVITYSVGHARVADLAASYYGTQRLTPDNKGEMVYGGSELVVARGGFEDLRAIRIPEKAQLAVAQALTYDQAAFEVFAGMFASRRNYDVAQGIDAQGRRRSGVLEQSWRIGGASGAEIAALEAFQADPELKLVRARTVEVYGESAFPPPHATVYFRGSDGRVGPMTKYAVIESYGDA
jgi:hypothetical protein